MGNFLYRSTQETPELESHQSKVPNGHFALTTHNLQHKNILLFGKRGRGKTTLAKHILTRLPFKYAHIVHDNEYCPVSYDDTNVKKTIYKGINENLVIDLMLDTKIYKDELLAFVTDTRKRCKTSKTYQRFMSKIIKEKPFTLLITSDTVDQLTVETQQHIDLIVVFKETNNTYLRQLWKTYLKNLDIPEHLFMKHVLSLEEDHSAIVIDLKTKELLFLPSVTVPKTSS